MEKQITRVETKLENIEREIGDIKGSIRTDYQTKEGARISNNEMDRLTERIIKIEGSLSKVVWIVLTAIISAILYLVIST